MVSKFTLLCERKRDVKFNSSVVTRFHNNKHVTLFVSKGISHKEILSVSFCIASFSDAKLRPISSYRSDTLVKINTY